MTYINFRGLPRINAPGVWVGGIPSHVYNWILENIEEPKWEWSVNNDMFLGITLEEDIAIVFKLKFKL